MTRQQLAPPATRITEVDALRGFALIGIFVVNVAFFASGYPFHLAEDPAYDSWLDSGVRWLVEFLFAMKFYLLFSFLFGYSFTLQIDSAARQGAAFTPRFRRRVAGLFVLGALHAVLLFHGDILTTYAVMGLILLGLRRIRAGTALAWACGLTGMMALFLALGALGGTVLVPDEAAALAAGQDATEALQGGVASVLAEHVRSFPAMASALIVQGPLALAAFLVGLAAGKRRLLEPSGAGEAPGAESADGGSWLTERCPRCPAMGRVIRLVGFPIGLAGALVFAGVGGSRSLAGMAVCVLTAPLLTAAYVVTALHIFHTGRGRRVARALAPAGRMALTNYLGQSLVGVLVFTGIGAGLAGEVSPPATMVVVAVVLVGQFVVSAWWLRRFRYGPVEWLLRAWTHQSWPPLRAG